MVNFVGAVVFSVIGFLYVKKRGKGNVARRFIPRQKKEDRDFLKIVEEEEELENHEKRNTGQTDDLSQKEKPGK